MLVKRVYLLFPLFLKYCFLSPKNHSPSRNMSGTEPEPKVFIAIRYIALAWILSCQINLLKTFLKDHSSP